MIKAIIFDLDGVLINSLEANTKFFQKLMKKAGYAPPSSEKYASIFHLNMMDVIKELTKSDSDKEIKRVWKMGNSRAVSYDSNLVTMPNGSAEAVVELSRDYLLGIVTNRVRNSVYEVPKFSKLKKYFKIAVSFEDTEKHKPDPEPLLLATKRLGVRPEETIYVGDAESDVQAALAAGIRIISYPKLLSGASAYVSQFKDLPGVVKSLE